MTVVVRRMAAGPARISSDVWSAVTRLVCRGDKAAEAEFEKVKGVGACLINDEAFANSPMSVRNGGPRLRVYCVYGDDAIAGEDVREAPLNWNPTKGDWTAYLPCLRDDVDVMKWEPSRRSVEQSDVIFTPFLGPVLWIGEEKIMIESLLPRAGSLAQFSPRDEPLAFLSSLGLCRIQSRENRF